MRWHFPLKFAGTTVFTGLFFVGYFHLLRQPSGPVTTMPLIFIDHWVAFQPSALYAYLTLWIYIGLGPGLQRDMPGLLACAAWIVAMCGAGLALFWLWPTAVPPLDIDVSDHAGFALLQGVDAAGNACPSMHVAAAMFTVVRVARVLREAGAPWLLRAFNVAWFTAIVWSTLATRQHVALDALAGALLGLAFVGASLRWQPRPGGAASVAKSSRAVDIIESDSKNKGNAS